MSASTCASTPGFVIVMKVSPATKSTPGPIIKISLSLPPLIIGVSFSYLPAPVTVMLGGEIYPLPSFTMMMSTI
jgi:hypothetical protein